MLKIKDLKTFTDRVQVILANFNHKLVQNDISKLNLLILEDIYVDYFGSKTAIKFLVKIQRIGMDEVILKPFDPKLLKTIYQALVDYKINLQKILIKDAINLKLPVMTTQKKNEIIKIWNQDAEFAKVQIRQTRHQLINYLKNELKVSKEELQKQQKNIQKHTDQEIIQVEKLLQIKTNNFLKV